MFVVLRRRAGRRALAAARAAPPPAARAGRPDPACSPRSLALAAAAFVFVRSRDDAEDPSRAVAQRFADAWARGDLDERLAADDRAHAAGSSRWRCSSRATARRRGRRRSRGSGSGRPGSRATARSRSRSSSRRACSASCAGRSRSRSSASGETARRGVGARRCGCPGCAPGERVQRRELRQPRRASVLDADGRRLSRESAAAALVERPRGALRRRASPAGRAPSCASAGG